MEHDQWEQAINDIQYSKKYYDDNFYEYRHLMLSDAILEKHRALSHMEDEWKALGVERLHTWVHYENHLPHLIILPESVENPRPSI
jgi:cyclin-dependent kinase regulatory subunit CKS1